MFGLQFIALLLGILFAKVIVKEKVYTKGAKISAIFFLIYLALNTVFVRYDEWFPCILFTLLPIVILILILFLEDEKQLSKKAGG